MQPVPFPEQNCVLGANQKEYQPLPAFRTKGGLVVSCWRLSFWQRLRLLFMGRVWAMQLTFGDPLQPQVLQISYPFAPEKKPTEPIEVVDAK